MENSIVSCSGGDCGVCSFLETLANAYNYILGVSFAVAVLVLVIAGFVYIFSAGKQRWLDKSKRILRGAVWGFAFVLVGWVVIRSAVSVVGFQNAGSWWQFQCTEDSTRGVSSSKNGSGDYLGSLKTYPELSNFLASGEKNGIIKGPISEDRFAKQLETLKNGERITFSVPVKQVYGGKEYTAQMTFLAGEKSGGVLNIDSKMLGDLFKMLAGSSGSNNISLISNTGKALTSGQSKELASSLISAIAKTLLGSLGSSGGSQGLLDILSAISSGNISQILSNPSSLNSAISSLSNALNSSIAQNPGKGLAGQVMAAIASNLQDKTALIANKATTGTDSGDRSASEASKSATSNTSSKDLSQPRTENDWKNNISQEEAKKNENNKTDDWKDLPQGKRDKDSDSDLDPSDFQKGDGSRQAIIMALKRVYKRDQKRYEMIFRFVSHIGKTDNGGLCTGCGDIYVTRKDQIINISHIIVHEGTHAGDFCLGSIFRKTRGEMEAVACANQIGSIDMQNHKDMREFMPQNTPSVIYKSGFSQGEGQIRGFLARYWDEDQPKGDLSKGHLESLFDYMTKYAEKNGYANDGEYHYGFCFKNEREFLKLNNSLENDVKSIVTSKDSCKSSPPKGLPSIKACEGSPEMQIE